MILKLYDSDDQSSTCNHYKYHIPISVGVIHLEDEHATNHLLDTNF